MWSSFHQSNKYLYCDTHHSTAYTEIRSSQEKIKKNEPDKCNVLLIFCAYYTTDVKAN